MNAQPIITRARYAKGMMLVRCPSNDSWKTRAARLCEHLNGRYTGRENGYVMSPRKAEKLASLFADGYDANFINNALIAP